MKGNLISTLVAILFFVTSFNLFSQQDLTPEQIYEKVNDAVVIVLAYDDNDKLINQGSGVVIKDGGYIMTNYHVTKNARKVNIVHGNLLIEDVEIIGGDNEIDILLIRISKSSLSTISIPESDDIKIGQRIYAIGSPMGYENTISEGIISGYRKYDNEMNLIQITASISSGSSGGAVVNSKGELIGISTYTITEGQNINFAIPLKEIRPKEIKPYVVSEMNTSAIDIEQKQNDRTIKTEPKNNFNHNPKAVEFLNQGKVLVEKANSPQSEKDRKSFLEQAIGYFEKAIKIDSNLVEAYYLAGKYHTSTSYLYNYKKAKKYLSKVETFVNDSKENILASLSNREILIEIANFYSLYSHFEGTFDEMSFKILEIYKKALEQPLPYKDKNPFYEYINDDYILYSISQVYQSIAKNLIYNSLDNSKDKFFNAIQYCDSALEYYKKLSSSFKEDQQRLKYYDIVKDKKLAESLWLTYDWKTFYTNVNRRAGILISDNNILFLYHPKTMTKEKNNILRVWIKKVNLKEPNEYELDYYDYSKSLYEFDLKNNKYRVLQYTSYKDDKVLNDENYSNAEWNFISPETIVETMIENIKLITK